MSDVGVPLKFRKLNDSKVKPIFVRKEKNKRRGTHLIPTPWANVFLCSKKESGKSIAAVHMIKNCADKNTTLIIVSATVHWDDVWQHAIEWAEDRDIRVIVLTDLLGNAETDKKEEPTPWLIRFITNLKATKERGMQDNKNYIIVFDDQSRQLRHKIIGQITKMNRHFKLLILFSSHDWTDMDYDARKQMDYVFLHHGQPLHRLEQIHEDLCLSMPFEHFLAAYNAVTQNFDDHNFLYINKNKSWLRKNFHDAIDLPTPQLCTNPGPQKPDVSP